MSESALFKVPKASNYCYKNYRMNNIVKEYGILKPALMHHRDFRNFMKSLDEVLNEADIDDVLKRSEDRDKKSK